jgi:hemerythrin-like metal-binding protein
MSVLKWHDRYLTGVPEVDAQHKALFAAICELYEALVAGNDDASPTMSFLTTYVATHFHDEERLMARWEYPGTADHHAAHVRLVHALNRHKALLAAGDRLAVLSFVKFMSEWLNGHILRDDLTFIAWFRERNPQL